MSGPVNSNAPSVVDGEHGGTRRRAAFASAKSVGEGGVFAHCVEPNAPKQWLRLADMAVDRGDARDVRGWIDCLGALVWPARCLVCREPGVAGRDLCPDCAARLPWSHSACVRCAIPLPGAAVSGDLSLAAAQTCGDCLAHPPPLTATHAAFIYGAPLDTLLPRFKFHQDLAAGRLLAQLMLPATDTWPRPDALIALPLHHARLRSRGYDQALELAKPLSRALALPLLRDGLRRVRATAPQSQLDAAQRRRNMRKAFVAGGSPLPAHVALIDDVMTTGATLHAAAHALRRAGVERVDAWVCARVP